MARRENLELDPELRMSPRLLGSLTTIQQILNAWVPGLHRVQVVAQPSLPAPPRRGAICFFSGGVDSAYTYLKNAEDITYLVLIHGLDIHSEDEASFARAFEGVRQVAEGLGKSVIPVRTNAREFCKANGLTMILFHGALLASVALLLGFERSYIPASQTYWDLDPWGSHALLDPLWSTEASQIIYDGAEARRIDKVRAVAEHPELLASLRVCAGEGQGSNCGECEKCLLTMLAMRLVGAKTPILPKLNLNRVKRLKPTLDNLEYYLEMHDVAQQVGDLEVEKLLRSTMRNFELRQILKRTDALLLGGRLRKLFGKPNRAHAPLLRPRDITSGDMDDVQAARLWRTDVSCWGDPGRSKKLG
jgi:bacterioferritin-associated ferredoxin